MSYPVHFHRRADGSSSLLRCYVLSFGMWLDYLPLKEKTLHSSDTSGTSYPMTHPRRRESSLPYLPTYSALLLFFALYRDILSSISVQTRFFFVQILSRVTKNDKRKLYHSWLRLVQLISRHLNLLSELKSARLLWSPVVYDP